MIRKLDRKHRFVSVFDPKTGFYARSGVFDNTGKDTGVDPFMASFPELIDVGVMGHCIHGSSGLCLKSGVQCYQNGLSETRPNMSLMNFKRIVDECKGKTFQLALGGRGDVDQHENFEDLLAYCRVNNIVPNFTSSGFGFTNKIAQTCREYCGAVAISWYRQPHTLRAIKMLLDIGVKTNIHYVLGKNSIKEAIALLKNNGFPPGINAIIFLLHKPVGLGAESNTLSLEDPLVNEFFETVDTQDFDFKIGFDSCSIPAILNLTRNIALDSVDTCEGARWSMYITSDMIALPCSFDNQEMRWAYDIQEDTIQHAWDSPVFDDFREHFIQSCPECPNRGICMGGCPIRPQIVLCDRKTKTTGGV